MFNIGFSEILVILILVVIFIGPKKMPEIARILGKGLGEFKRASEDLKASLTEDAVRSVRNRGSDPDATPLLPKMPAPESEESGISGKDRNLSG